MPTGLWQARVCWRTPGCDLSARKVGQLLDAAVSVMTRAIAAGGHRSMRCTSTSAAAVGYFQRDLAAYGQEGLPCLRCGTAILREPFANRSSYRCPRAVKRCRRVP